MCNESTQTLCNAYIHDILHRHVTMNSFRLTTVKNTMLIYAHSFRSVSHYFPVGSQKLFFSRTGFVYVKNWKNSENSSISQLCFLFVIYFRFIITLVKGMFDFQIDKKKKQKTVFNEYKLWKKTTAHSQNILHVDVLHNIKRMAMILYRTCNFFSLFAMQLDYCNIQRVFDQK